MILNDTDRVWEKYGARDPYYGVLTRRKYRADVIDKNAKDEFFKLGEKHLQAILNQVKRLWGEDVRPSAALDFGCGVGRVLIPMAGISKKVVGVDVSQSMLIEAAKNCKERGIDNVSFVRSDDDLSAVTGSYDFIHSFIVFQHIAVGRGVKIFEHLIERLAHDGIGVLHFMVGRKGFRQKLLAPLKRVPLVPNIYNLTKGRPFFDPPMQMNVYDINKIFRILKKHGIQEVNSIFTDHDGNFGVILYFKKIACVPGVDLVHFA